MRFRLISGPQGPRSRPFMGYFVTFPSRQLLAQTEARMTHFITRTVPPPRADYSLKHSTTRLGLRARRVRILFFPENVRFGRFSWASTRFSAPGPIFWKPPGLSQNNCRWHFMRFRLISGPQGPRSRPFMGFFVTFPSRQLLGQTEARMTHFVTRTVPSPHTDHSLRHSTTRLGLRARRVRIQFFRENVRFGRFSWAIAHGFRHEVQFFGNLPDCQKILVDDILWGFDWFLDHRVHVAGLFRVISLPFLQKITSSNGS
jgi:hypothetical protein